jgi:uncharacterized membrane protein
MSFLLLMTMAAFAAWSVSWILNRPIGVRDAMRVGAAAAFLLTGVDHFASAETRYVPMMPEFFGATSLPLVLLTGAAEIAGAIGLLIPRGLSARWGFPRLRYWTGVSLAVMLAFLVIANVNVAVTGGGVDGLDFAPWYFWLRPLFQPLIILWVLYAAGVAWPRRSANESGEESYASRHSDKANNAHITRTQKSPAAYTTNRCITRL